MNELFLKLRSTLASRYFLPAVLAGLYMAVFLLTRVVLLAVQHAVSRNGFGPTLIALGAGEVFDAVVTLWLVAPLVLYLSLLPERWFQGRIQRVVLWTGLAVSTFSALFTAAVEYYFFEEFNSRFNFVAVDYLAYPTEVADNVWQSYHVALVLTLVIVLTGSVLLLLRRPLREAWRRVTPPLRRLAFVAGFAAILAGATWTVSPALAHVSEDRALNEIAVNGYYSFFMALLGKDAPYEGLYATRPQPAVMARLQRLLGMEKSVVPASFTAGSTLRKIDNPGPSRRLNVVVVLEESLGSDLVGSLHPRPESLTPSFDALTAEGTLLTHAFSTGNRTVRAIEATTSSLPPLPGESIVRRDNSVGLFTLPSVLAGQGYETMFVYGGRALFDGKGTYLHQNGVHRLVDQSSYPPGTFTTAWGVCDEAIFAKALEVMDEVHAEGRPFYSLVLSVSNHRPFTFPQDHVREEKRFHRRENVVRYADWALGQFMARAKSHVFYQDTLFVLMGDHGARVYGAAEIPLPSYEVPILFIGPGVPLGTRLETLASSLDVPPTILGVLGLDYDSKFFGHDVFRTPPEDGRALMTHGSEIALMRGGRMAVLGLRESTTLYKVDEARNEIAKVSSVDPAGHELIEDAIAYYNAADRLYRSGAFGYALSQTQKAGPGAE
ncbi:MAG TPA: LTA synthase family protein [Thermoanaerobaculia bacterium]|nr:LTA synthase family protein [Thermoanaerobaculia bacterium]